MTSFQKYVSLQEGQHLGIMVSQTPLFANDRFRSFSLYDSDLFAVKSDGILLVIPYLVAGIGLPAVGAVIDDLKAVNDGFGILKRTTEPTYVFKADRSVLAITAHLQNECPISVIVRQR